MSANALAQLPISEMRRTPIGAVTGGATRVVLTQTAWRAHNGPVCDTFVSLPDATADGSVILAKNSDGEPNEAHELALIPAAAEQPTDVLRAAREVGDRRAVIVVAQV